MSTMASKSDTVEPAPAKDIVIKKKKRILFGITKANWGGAQRYVFDLATHLPADKFEIIVMGGAAGLLKEKLMSAGIRFIEIAELDKDISFLREPRVFWQILKAIRAEKPDILHLNSPKMAGMGTLAGRMAGVAWIVVTIHGWSFHERRFFAIKLLIAFFSWMTALMAHQTILITEKDLRTAKFLPPYKKGKYRLVHNGIGALELQDDASSTRENLKQIIARLYPDKAGALDEPIWIGTLAELTPNKDPATLVRAAAGLPWRIPVIIIGDGGEREKLIMLIKKLGAEDQILLAGFIPEAARLLSAFTIFVLSSIKEGLPYALLEAGQRGLPVIATNVGGIPDIIEHEMSGILVPAQNAAEMREAIIHLAGDPARRKRLGAALQKKVAHKFGISRMVRETLAVYNQQEL